MKACHVPPSLMCCTDGSPFLAHPVVAAREDEQRRCRSGGVADVNDRQGREARVVPPHARRNDLAQATKEDNQAAESGGTWCICIVFTSLWKPVSPCEPLQHVPEVLAPVAHHEGAGRAVQVRDRARHYQKDRGRDDERHSLALKLNLCWPGVRTAFSSPLASFGSKTVLLPQVTLLQTFGSMQGPKVRE